MAEKETWATHTECWGRGQVSSNEWQLWQEHHHWPFIVERLEGSLCEMRGRYQELREHFLFLLIITCSEEFALWFIGDSTTYSIKTTIMYWISWKIPVIHVRSCPHFKFWEPMIGSFSLVLSYITIYTNQNIHLAREVNCHFETWKTGKSPKMWIIAIASVVSTVCANKAICILLCRPLSCFHN